MEITNTVKFFTFYTTEFLKWLLLKHMYTYLRQSLDKDNVQSSSGSYLKWGQRESNPLEPRWQGLYRPLRLLSGLYPRIITLLNCISLRSLNCRTFKPSGRWLHLLSTILYNAPIFLPMGPASVVPHLSFQPLKTMSVLTSLGLFTLIGLIDRASTYGWI